MNKIYSDGLLSAPDSVYTVYFRSLLTSFQLTKLIFADVEQLEKLRVKKILIADDEPLTFELIKEFLHEAKLNCVTLHADTGRKAYELAIKELPDLIITDWIMPEFDGPDLIRKLKKNDLTKNIQIVLTTGGAFPDHLMEKAMEAGAVDCLLKPLGEHQFLTCITPLLAKEV